MDLGAAAASKGLRLSEGHSWRRLWRGRLWAGPAWDSFRLCGRVRTPLNICPTRGEEAGSSRHGRATVHRRKAESQELVSSDRIETRNLEKGASAVVHIAEGFLPATHSVMWGLASAPFVVHGARAVIQESKRNPESKLLLAAAGAFTFVLSAIKLPSVTGSSSHPTGTGAGAILFRPPVMAFLGTVVLLFQALLLAHGGLTTLGANVFSMAIAGPWAAYAVWRLVRASNGPMEVGVFLAMATANLATYVVTSAQLAIAYPAPDLLGALAKFASVFALTQIPLALMEGLVGVLLFRFLAKVAAPELVRRGIIKQPAKEAAHV